ncbi:hypothetical protein BDZ97DRAFT_1901496 [Flammula alnicola]|nr:hypothetical protein BDZ97DRAFT_1901496 [Flammula alnicola]
MTVDTRHIFSAGLGGKARAGIYWVVIIWAAGQQARKQLGLPAKHFHVTLSSNDIHDVDKGITSLLPGQFSPSPSAEFLDHITFTFHYLGQHDLALEYSSRQILFDPASHKGFLRMGDASLAGNQHKMAMLAYACAYERVAEDKIKAYCMKKLVECSKETEWGPVFQEYEIPQLDRFTGIASFLLMPCEQTLSPTLLLEPRQSLFVPSPSTSMDDSRFYKLPRFFRWLIPYHLAIMSTPLVRRQPKLPLLVHCGGGKGRAGTVAACYLAAFGFRKPFVDQGHPELSAAEAIASLRVLRPGSIETSQQEAFVSKWCSTIWKRQSVYPDIPSEPAPSPMETEGTLTQENDLFMLVGLPGSGKSWFSKSLMARDPSKWLHISQDDSGSRDSCETEIGRLPSSKHVLLDRCNTSQLCTSRAQRRAGHPTLPPGSRVRHHHCPIICCRPRSCFTISTPLMIYKFPRTPHLLNLGAATPDDVHADTTSFVNVSGHVIVTEKIDGANMGFSLSSDRSRILVQNRSHYVNSSTHEQFKKLGLWIERHEEELRIILDRDPYFPERYILYGEWMYATHSIPYTRLPDYFIAYDLFDRSTQTWLETKALHGLLDGTSIPSVPVLHEGNMPTDAELLGMIQGQSAFYDGRVEGVYVKVEVNSRVKLRGKVVRSDFIAGNEHWTQGGLRANTLQLDTSLDN